MSDLISRKALLEAINEHEEEWRKHGEQGELTSYATGLGLRIAMEVIEEQPAVEPMKWIPCSERLPEKYTKVLVWRPLVGHDIYALEDEHYWGDDYGYWIPLDAVTAWMPLPAPYKEGDIDG